MFFIYSEEKYKDLLKDEQYIKRIKSLVLKKILETKNDTVSFSGSWVSFNDTIKDNKQWWVEWAIVHLTKTKRLKIIDSANRQLKTIKINKIGSYRKGYLTQFINRYTNEIMFTEIYNEYYYKKKKKK